MKTQKMKDGKAVAYFKRLANDCAGSYAGLADTRYRLGDDTYRCYVDTHIWIATVYRHDDHSINGVEVGAFDLDDALGK